MKCLLLVLALPALLVAQTPEHIPVRKTPPPAIVAPVPAPYLTPSAVPVPAFVAGRSAPVVTLDSVPHGRRRLAWLAVPAVAGAGLWWAARGHRAAPAVVPGDSTLQVVPEPAAWVMVAAGLALLAACVMPRAWERTPECSHLWEMATRRDGSAYRRCITSGGCQNAQYWGISTSVWHDMPSRSERTIWQKYDAAFLPGGVEEDVG